MLPALNLLALTEHVDTCFTYQLVRSDVSQPPRAFHRPNIFDKTAGGVQQCSYANSALRCLVTVDSEFNSLRQHTANC